VSAPADRVDPEPANDAATDTDVVLETGTCGHANDRILGNVDLDSPQVIQACATITLQADVTVSSNVVLQAPSVRINEIRVLSGTLTIINAAP
jgi:hypothetical protein